MKTTSLFVAMAFVSSASAFAPAFKSATRSTSLSMADGTVKWFNEQKGYGFIAPDDESKDVFVHISAVQKAGFETLEDGQKLTYEIVESRGKESADDLQLIE